MRIAYAGRQGKLPKLSVYEALSNQLGKMGDCVGVTVRAHCTLYCVQFKSVHMNPPPLKMGSTNTTLPLLFSYSPWQKPQSKELGRGPPELVQYFCL
jgi:hypothetical protein